DMSRDALLGRARGSSDGSEVNAMGAIGYDWKFHCLNIGPVASFQYTNVDINHFSETGNSLIPLDIPDQSEDSLRTTVGIRASLDIKIGGSIILRPEVRAAWLHEYGDQAYPIDARFQGCPQLFTVRGPNVGEDAALVGAGLTVQFSPMISVFAFYDGVLGRDNYSSNAVSGGLRASF